MGTPKGELVVDGERLVDRAVRVLRAGGCADVIVVTRAGVDVPGVHLVVNPDPERGMRSSLALAVDAVPPDADALAVLLVDLPGVTATAVRAVLAAWRPGRVAVARYGARCGHPTVMAPELWRAALEPAGPDEGARTWLGAHPQLVDEVVVDGDSADLDTPADLDRWTARRRGRPDELS